MVASTLGAVLVAAPAAAEVPREFLGKWTSRPGHCEQRNGEVDVLEVTPSGLAVYEVGCDLGRSEPISGGVRFVAQCYKGGGPVSAGAVTLRRLGQGGIEFALLDFSWASDEAQRFSRCRTGRAR
ncbi:hypothetical protein [Bosea sp. LjRoot237]|uniref:hypothetical protein n=1 Tax=Bosea sp. LjRoot237 TaxID=3342292 RepID=UPI003ECD3529